MISQKNILISFGVFAALFAVLTQFILNSMIAAFVISVFGASINYFILKSKNGDFRIALFCVWGIVFALLVVLSNYILDGHFICPSKIPLAGQKAGEIPLVPSTSVPKNILPCPFGIFQNYQSTVEVHGFLLSAFSLSIKLFGLIFFIWLFLSFFFGRSWCGWICPFGAFGETFARMGKTPYWNLNLARNTARGIRYGFFAGIFLLLLTATIAPNFAYCVICPFKGVYHSPGYWSKIFTFFPEFLTYFLFISLFIVVPFLVKKRVWCAVLCPMGTLTSLLSRFRLIETRIDLDSCPNCKLCIDACKVDIISKKEGSKKIIGSTSCTNCGDCMSMCPKDAIKYHIRGTSIEVKKTFIPIIVVFAISIGVTLTAIMWKPLFGAIAKILSQLQE